ncbi:MAG: transposase [Advenella sp.]
MDYLEEISPEPTPLPRRRIHSQAFKAQLVALCKDPAVSVAAIARAHDINDNMLHRWIKEANVNSASPNSVAVPESSFIAVPMSSPPARSTETTSAIHLELQGKQFNLNLQWPAHDAMGCATFIRELLK